MKLFETSLIFLSWISICYCQCPWSRELLDLHSDCICAFNSVQRLSIQCSPVNFPRLMSALHTSVQNIPIDLMYVSNGSIATIEDGTFHGLDIQSLHLANSKISNLSLKAFEGLETTLTSLNLHNNLLTEIPIQQIGRLTTLKQLDLSHNKLTNVPDGAFQNLPLATLKLSDNKLKISDGAFKGLQGTLKTLNLKSSGLESMPKAIQKLSALSFLDVAQNQLSSLEPGFLQDLHSLTAINMERNRLLKVDSKAFRGVNDSLSSLSLLNNLLVEFPVDAVSSLTKLRVLDLGFNGIRILPEDAFKNNLHLTLLALDGNPISTVPLVAFQHLKSSLRGISIGGPYLECDCRIRWIVEWVRDNDLQVTSREKNPQFCGKPESLQRRNFFQLSPTELQCENEPQITTLKTTTYTPSDAVVTEPPRSKEPKFLPYPVQSFPSTSKTYSPAIDLGQPVQPKRKTTATFPSYQTTPSPTTRLTETQTSLTSRSSGIVAVDSSSAGTKIPYPVIEEVKIRDAFRTGNSIMVEWDSNSSNLLGFQVVYRVFGEEQFTRGPSLVASQRQYAIPNVPTDDCVIVCVVTLEDIPNLSVDAIPYSQCREIKNSESRHALDKIVIAGSAAVCGVIIIAVIIFVCCYCRKQKKEKPTLPPPTTGAPAVKSEHEWESASMYSGRSIPRPRMYQSDPNGSINHSFIMDDNRSHLSHYSQVPNGHVSNRPTADGQSHRSYTQLSHRFGDHLSLGNPDIRKSQQSLSQLSGHHSFLGSHISAPPKKKKTRRDNKRITSASSVHSLTEYESDWNGKSDNWKDQDVDIYVGRTHVAPPHGKYRKDYGAR
ncbi:vasorin-like [Limulus polyphemus]|uniref:Vasorin-like n=1 Tax=Limulus polyphemus TaxID=6850 RepID=A0ABM1SE20_LIMPO|nr:vasorin-like [Limulus polyphemus]XP_022241875.1 vasorin-like [Limulus polyphemus]